MARLLDMGRRRENGASSRHATILFLFLSYFRLMIFLSRNKTKQSLPVSSEFFFVLPGGIVVQLALLLSSLTP